MKWAARQLGDFVGKRRGVFMRRWAAMAWALVSLQMAQAGLARQANAAIAPPRVQCRATDVGQSGHLGSRRKLPFAPSKPNVAELPLLTIWAPDGNVPAAQVWLAQGPNGLSGQVAVPFAHACAGAAVAGWNCERLELRIRLSSAGQAGEAMRPEAEQTDASDSVFFLFAEAERATAALLAGKPAAVSIGQYVRRAVDGARQAAVYDFELPWSLLATSPGMASVLQAGVALQPAASVQGPQPTWRAHYPAAGGMRPGALAEVALARPAPPYAAVQAEWLATSSAMDPMIFRARGDCTGATLRAIWQDGGKSSSAASCPLGSGAFDMEVRVTPLATGNARKRHAPPSLMLSVVDAAGRPLAEAMAAPQPIHASVAAAQRRLARLLERSAEDPRAARHARVLQAALDDAVARGKWGSGLERSARTREAQALAEAISAVPQGPNAPPAAAVSDPWALSLQSGERASVEACASPVDNALALGVLFSPTRAVESQENRPLLVFLHGRTDPSQAPFVEYFTAPRGDAQPDAFVLTPWARGDLGAQELGESDVLALIDAVAERYPIDANAITLAGFSLGASGAFSVAVHAPERFAAVALASGGSWLVPLGRGLGGNVRSLPFFLWHGALDNVVSPSEQQRIIAEFDRSGVTYEAHLDRSVGHTISAETKEQMVQFLRGKRRSEKRSFSYVSDGPLHRGRSGLSLRHDAQQEPFPRLTVYGGPAGWHIEVRGSDGLEFAPGALGATPSEQCTVSMAGRLQQWPCSPRSFGAGATRP